MYMDMLKIEEINNLRNSVDIVEVISKYIPLVQKGRNNFGVCPFHDDHSPSMSVSKEKQIYKCFTCGATGNVFNFIMDYENVSFKEALLIVSKLSGNEIDLTGIKSKTLPNQQLYDIYEISTKFYQNNINTVNGKKAKEYLSNRQINEEIIKEFHIGLSLKDDDLLASLLINKGYEKQNIINSGLIIKTNSGLFDIYKNRIMFPLWDIGGRIVGYSGRVYNGEKDSKYINTRETEIFKKGDLLYNYHRAKDDAREKNTIIIVEGFMDVIRLYSVGIKNVVATMGTAVTKQQVNLIKRMAKNIILCFDGDSAGEKATMSCLIEFENIGIQPKIIRLEEDLDPDDYIKKYGKDKFSLKLENSINSIDFKMLYLKNGKDFKNSLDLSNYINNVIDELNKMDDEILKEITLNKISIESGIDLQVLKGKLKPIIKDGKQNPIKKTTRKFDKYEKAQMYLVYYMLRSIEVIKLYNKKVTFMPTERYRKLAYEIDYFYKKMNGNLQNFEADFITYLTTENQKMLSVVSEIQNLNMRDEYTIDEINDYVNTILEFNIKTECTKLKEAMINELDPVKKANLLQKIIELKKN